MEHYYISSTKANIQERQTKLNGKVYDIVFRIVTLDGDEKQKRLSGYKTKALAKEAHLEFIQKYCELVKRNPIKKKKAVEKGKDELTVEALAPLYIASMSNQNKDSTIYDRRGNLYNFILPYFQNARIADLTPERLYKWQDDLWRAKNPKTGDYYSYSHLSNIRGTMSTFLAWCEIHYGTVNNLRKVKKPKRRTPKTAMQFWTREEFDKFIAVVDNPTYRAFFYTLFFTGRRKGEVIALNADDVHRDYIVFDKTYTRKTVDKDAYKITTTKNERRAKTIICEPLKAALAAYTPQKPFYFGGDAPIHENTIAHAFDRYIEKSGVKRIRIHDLRHSFVSMCIHLGASVYVVADLIGDTVAQVFKTYGHLYDEDKQEIISRIK
nr:MAG TPA: Integrase [Caudoviricetes sp.]